MRRVSCASTSAVSSSRGLATARAIASGVISWKTIRRTGHAGLEGVDQVPGDGLALAVLVCREVDLAGVLHQLLEPADLLLAVGADDVERLEGVVDVDAEPGPGGALVLGRDVGGVARQVADVPDARLDDVAAAQVPGDLVRLRRRLHDDQRLAPGRRRTAAGRAPSCRRRSRRCSRFRSALVFVGTVLLSVVLRYCELRCVRWTVRSDGVGLAPRRSRCPGTVSVPRNTPWRATVSHGDGKRRGRPSVGVPSPEPTSRRAARVPREERGVPRRGQPGPHTGHHLPHRGQGRDRRGRSSRECPVHGAAGSPVDPNSARPRRQPEPA